MGELTRAEIVRLEDALGGSVAGADNIVAAVQWIAAAHVERATADAEIVRAEWERQYGYAVEAAERFRKRAAEAEAQLAAVRGLTSLGAQAGSINGRLYIFTSDLIAALNSASTTDADGRDERRDGDVVEHVGGCNEGCHGDDHLLLADDEGEATS